MTEQVRASDIHRVDWSEVSVPGSACGAISTIHLRDGGAVVRSTLYWPAVAVGAVTAPVYGDLDGTGQDAAFVLLCTNDAGTIEGDLGEAAVIYRLRDHVLEVVGVATPRQPYGAATPHAPFVTSVVIERGQVVVHEAWYGPNDFPGGPSGKATTIWRLIRGILVPIRTVVVWEEPPAQ